MKLAKSKNPILPHHESGHQESILAWDSLFQSNKDQHASEIPGFFDLVQEHNDDMVLFAHLYAQALDSGAGDAMLQAYIHFSSIAVHVVPLNFCAALCKEFQAKRAMIIKMNDILVIAFKPQITLH